jgi:hypothetical protein
MASTLVSLHFLFEWGLVLVLHEFILQKFPTLHRKSCIVDLSDISETQAPVLLSRSPNRPFTVVCACIYESFQLGNHAHW